MALFCGCCPVVPVLQYNVGFFLRVGVCAFDGKKGVKFALYGIFLCCVVVCTPNIIRVP